jgi:hypothetical protein
VKKLTVIITADDIAGIFVTILIRLLDGSSAGGIISGDRKAKFGTITQVER